MITCEGVPNAVTNSRSLAKNIACSVRTNHRWESISRLGPAGAHLSSISLCTWCVNSFSRSSTCLVIRV